MRTTKHKIIMAAACSLGPPVFPPYTIQHWLHLVILFPLGFAVSYGTIVLLDKAKQWFNGLAKRREAEQTCERMMRRRG